MVREISLPPTSQQSNSVRMPQRTLPGLARNLGIEMATGELLAFTDADCVPEPLWIAKMVQAHAGKTVSP